MCGQGHEDEGGGEGTSLREAAGTKTPMWEMANVENNMRP